MSGTSYKNPLNGYQESISCAGLWCFLFGPLYFAVKGVWTQALLSLVLIPITAGISWLVYPFLAHRIIEQNYFRKGWKPVDVAQTLPSFNKSSFKTLLLIGASFCSLLFVALIAGVIGSLSHHSPATLPTTATASANTPTEHQEPVTAWNYTTTKDTMTQKDIWSATTTSINTLSLAPPYNVPQSATLELRRHPQFGKDVIFQIERGQLLCDSYNDCSVLVRFDNQPAEHYAASPAADHSTTVLFIKSYDKFVQKTLTAKKVYIQVRLYQNGNQSLEFNVAELKLNKATR